MSKLANPLALYGLDKSELIDDPELAWVHRLVLSDLKKLIKAAAQAGFNLSIFSGYRDFHRQLTIWNNKWNGLRPILDANSRPLDISSLSDEHKLHAILRWSALPGTSRHHWGTDFDFYDPKLLPSGTRLELIPQEYAEQGCQHALSIWLSEYAQDFGFFYPYLRFKGGVEFEPWHLSHLATSQTIMSKLDASQTLEHLRNNQVAGFACIEQHIEQIFSQYVTNICLPET